MTDLLKKRSRVSFAVFISSFLLFAAMWFLAKSSPPEQNAPAPFRKFLDLNGKIWHSAFGLQKKDHISPPPNGKSPRINGDLGMDEEVDSATWKIEVIPDDQNPKASFLISLTDLRGLPRTESSSEFRCIEGWSEAMSFAGVKFSDFMTHYHLSPKKYVGLRTRDGEYYVSIDIESMIHQQTLLAYEMNGETLKLENGAPVRLSIPVKYGIKNLKQIGQIFFSDRRPPDYWEERGYDWFAGL